jgi:hypothetical protein
MLSPVVPHDAPEEPLSQLIVMGRFSLAGTKGELRFQSSLFGKQASERLLKITVTRKSDNQKHVFELTPATPAGMLFAEQKRSLASLGNCSCIALIPSIPGHMLPPAAPGLPRP